MPYKKHIETGGLLPDSLIFYLLNKEIRAIPLSPYILDGAVRNINQAQIALERRLFDKVLYFELSDEESLRRIECRRRMEGRKDDNPQIALIRLEEYKNQTEPILDLLRKSERIEYNKIDASRKITPIHYELLEILVLPITR